MPGSAARTPAEPAHNRGVSAGLTLHLEKVLAARPETVFAACVEPDTLAEWWGPEGFTAPASTSTFAKAGGIASPCSLRIGEAFHLRGEYREVVPPRRLVYTFEWEPPDPDDQETVVSLPFLDDREGTKVVLDQGPFATEARRALHEAGWTDSLERLERSPR